MQNATFEENPHANKRIGGLLGCAISLIARAKHGCKTRVHRWLANTMLWNTFDDKSKVVQLIAWYCQATSHYLNQCWPRSMSRHVISLGPNKSTLVMLNFILNNIKIYFRLLRSYPDTELACRQLKLFLMEDKDSLSLCLFSIVNNMAADDLAIRGARDQQPWCWLS